MNSNKKTTRTLEDVKINVKMKLSALWAAVMFLYVYGDLKTFYKPGIIEGIIEGKAGSIKITQAFLLGSAILMAIPIFMVFLSLTLKAKANRWTNIIVGISQIGLVLGSAIGDPNIYWIFAHGVEAVFLALIVWYAWKWPKQERGEVTP